MTVANDLKVLHSLRRRWPYKFRELREAEAFHAAYRADPATPYIVTDAEFRAAKRALAREDRFAKAERRREKAARDLKASVSARQRKRHAKALRQGHAAAEAELRRLMKRLESR